MFNRLPLIIAALLVASTATAADRQDSSYIGLQANQLALDFGQEATVSMLTASMGYRFNPYIALVTYPSRLHALSSKAGSPPLKRHWPSEYRYTPISMKRYRAPSEDFDQGRSRSVAILPKEACRR